MRDEASRPLAQQHASPSFEHALSFLLIRAERSEGVVRWRRGKQQSLTHGLCFRGQWWQVRAGKVIVQVLSELPCCFSLFEGHNIL